MDTGGGSQFIWMCLLMHTGFTVTVHKQDFRMEMFEIALAVV